MGAYLQQLAQKKDKEENDLPPSKLASQLLQKWAWGLMIGPQVQQLAEAALEDGLTHPAACKDWR